MEVIKARYVVPVVPENTTLDHHSVVISDGKIIDILPNNEVDAKYPNPKVVRDLSKDHVLIPGLINMHCHTPMILLRGFADDVQLQEWLMVI